MRKAIISIMVVTMLAMSSIAAFADLSDTGPKGDLEQACEDMNGEFEANGWGQSGNPTCTVEDEGELIKDNPGVTIEREGGELVYTHTDTTTDRNLVTGGSWDDGVGAGAGEVCITVKKTGKIICPKGMNK
jgi:hypothetical protein